MTSAVVTAIKILTTPVSDSSVGDAASSQQDVLLVALRSNREALLQQLQSNSSFEEVRRLREKVMLEVSWFSCATDEEDDDATWCFVQECLLLLLVLSRHLSAEVELFERTPASRNSRSAESAPSLPPDVLSVSQQRILGAALQFVVSLGLCPYLAPGVGVALGRRSAFGAMVEKLVQGGTTAKAQHRLLTTATVLLKVSQLSSLATVIFTQHLGDLMAALCQLGHRPQRPEGRSSEQHPKEEEKQQQLSAEEKKRCRDALQHLLGRVYQPMVIKELLILQGGTRQRGAAGSPGPALGSAPAWLRRLCGQLLSERLMKPNGVQAVVRAILEGGTGGDSDWRKCDSVARILVACPQQCSAEQYYRQVCPQILQLLHFKDKVTAQQFQRVATRAALSMVQEKSSYAQTHLLEPLMEPLHRCSDVSPVVVEEAELTRCVDDIYKICVVGNDPSDLLLRALEEVLPVIFTLYCFTKQNVSHLRAPCQDILLWYLNQTEPPAALAALKRLSGLTRQTQDRADAHFHFSPGSEGGAKFTPRDAVSEDDALYEKVSQEQWRLECLVHLLDLLKDSDLPGDFFLELLQELTGWAASAHEATEDQEELDVSTMTLLEVEQRVLGEAERKTQKLVVLQVIAVMVETLQHDVLLRRTTQVVDFMASLLRRACVLLDQQSELQNLIDSQTLRMGMGVVATLLSGPQLSSEDYRSMEKLLDPLETLSQNHPDAVVQELASNLRTVIATHGACQYRSSSPTTAAGSAADRVSGNPKDKATTHSVKKQEIQPEGKETRTCPAGSDPASSRTNTAQARPAAAGSPSKALSDWLLEACDPDVPTKALALRVLTQMVQNGTPEAVQNQEKLLALFLENLEHQDSFIYLSAIQALATLADVFPEKILERLLKDFQHGPSLPTSDKERSLESRLKVGEVLMRASRAMGELAPHLGRPLVGVFLQGTKDVDRSVRASSLSNLGELCQRLDYALGPLAPELSLCLVAVIKTDKEAEVRRAAVHVIAVLLRGLSNKTTEVLSEVLLELYRALKWTLRCDPDQVTVLHAQLALEELDDVMRRFMFPQQTLEKKIVVLP